MRVISGFVAAAMLAVLAQPALAVCVYHGSAKHCQDDPKFWTPSQSEKETSAQDLELTPSAPPVPGSVKTIVMEPDGSTGGNAWVMTPQSGESAIKPASASAPVPACEPGLSC